MTVRLREEPDESVPDYQRIRLQRGREPDGREEPAQSCQIRLISSDRSRAEPAVVTG